MQTYLDIETTFSGTISVIGMYRPDYGVIQLVGGGVNDLNLYNALEGVDTIITFNGACFDLPVIARRLAADLRRDYAHIDLLRTCRKRGLRGGLKRVETLFGIERETEGMSGYDAPRLWHRYDMLGDRKALDILLNYNREDVVNLALLEACLAAQPLPTPTSEISVLLA